MGTKYQESTTWTVFRTVKAGEDTLYTAATQKNAGSAASDGTMLFGKTGTVGAIAVRFKGTAAADLTLSWYLWARKSLADPAEYVAHGTATTGLSQTGTTNEFYADTIVITDQQWYTTVKVVADAPATVIADAGVSKLAVDSCEYQVWEIQIRDIAGGAGECATAGADILNFEL